jgi:hypothetical protein
VLNDAKDKVAKHGVTQLEVVLETITQIKVQNEVALLEPLLGVVTLLSGLGTGTFYLVELGVQQCISIINNNKIGENKS